MSPLWILPVLVVAVGFTALAFTARRLAAAARSAADAVDDLRVLGEEAAALRVEADAASRRGTAVLDPHTRASGATRVDR